MAASTTTDLSPSPPLPADDAALLIHYLQTHDAICPLCKYNLRHLTVPRCPECGREIRMTVGLVEPNIRWYITLLVALLLPAGLGLIALLVVPLTGLTLYREMESLMRVYFIGFQLSVVPGLAAVLCRRRFLKLGVPTQRMVALISLVEPILLYAMVIVQTILHP